MRNSGSIANRHAHGQRRTRQRDLMLLVAGGPLGRRPVIVRSVDEMPRARIVRIYCKQLSSTCAVPENEVWTPSRTTLASRRISGCEPDVIYPDLGNRYG